MPTNINISAITGGGARITWTDDANKHGVEVWRSDGDAYALIDTVDQGVQTYDDETTDVGTYNYKLRSIAGLNTSGTATEAAEAPLEFLFESNGDGSDLGYFGLEVSEDTTMTIDGNGRFYEDIDGTIDLGQSFEVTTGDIRTVCIKVTSGTAKLRIKNLITKWGDDYTGSPIQRDGWNTAGLGDIHFDEGTFDNVPTCITDVSKMTHNTSINVFGLNRLYGDLTGNTIMKYMEIADGTTRHRVPGSGQATCGGDISTMVNLEVLDVWDDTIFYGDVTGLTKMKLFWLGGYTEVDGDISGMTDLRGIVIYANSVAKFNCTGTLNNSPNFTALSISAELQEEYFFTGNTSLLTKMYLCQMYRPNNITIDNFTALTNLSLVSINYNVVSSAVVNQLLADVWANKDVAKTLSDRNIDIYGAVGSGAPTGQGITDKTNLQAYRTPNNDPAYNLWTIKTR